MQHITSIRVGFSSGTFLLMVSCGASGRAGVARRASPLHTTRSSLGRQHLVMKYIARCSSELSMSMHLQEHVSALS